MLANLMANIEAQQKSDRNVQNLHHISSGRPICAASALIMDDVGVTLAEPNRSRRRCSSAAACARSFCSLSLEPASSSATCLASPGSNTVTSHEPSPNSEGWMTEESRMRRSGWGCAAEKPRRWCLGLIGKYRTVHRLCTNHLLGPDLSLLR